MDKTKPKMRYTDAEMQLIKQLFADNDDLLTVIRKFILQMPMTKADEKLLETLKKDSITNLLRKVILPTLDPDAPRHQMVDLWMTIKLEDKTPELAYPHLQSRELLINYLDQQLSVLEGKKQIAEIRLDNLVTITEDSHETFINLMARNTIIGHIELQLSSLLILAGYKEESVEQTQRRLQQNSAK